MRSTELLFRSPSKLRWPAALQPIGRTSVVSRGLGPMQTALPLCRLRARRDGDEPDAVRRANNLLVAQDLRDRFPHPYTLADAKAFFARVKTQDPATNWAIAVADRPVGGVGLVLGTDVERVSAELGYWLGQEYWG